MKKTLSLLFALCFAWYAGNACTAGFTYTVSTVSGHPHHVNFTFKHNTSGTSQGIFYQINFGDGITTTVENTDTISHNYTAAGNYNVKLVITISDTIASSTICADSITQSLVVSSLSASSATSEVSNINIFPNPSCNTMCITGLPLVTDKLYVAITDIGGHLVFEENMFANTESVLLHLDELINGNYLVNIRKGEFNITRPITIQK